MVMHSGCSMKSKVLLWMALGACMWPGVLWAQSGAAAAVGEASAQPGDAKTSEPVPARSPLWMAVDAQYRQRDADANADQRRLTPEQRHQLREQVRRAANPVGTPGAGPALSTRPGVP